MYKHKERDKCSNSGSHTDTHIIYCFYIIHVYVTEVSVNGDDLKEIFYWYLYEDRMSFIVYSIRRDTFPYISLA